MKLALCAQMRDIDSAAINEYGVPGISLMENAAVSIFRICQRLDAYKQKKTVIFCGVGNNGGDGFALARHLCNDGADVLVILAGIPEKIHGDAFINYNTCIKMDINILSFNNNIDISNYPLIIDAMLGTGVSGELKEPISSAVSLINDSKEKYGGFVLSVDCPTGGNPDNGHITNNCVMADLTVTLGMMKPGLLLYPLADYAGKIELGQIGAPQILYDNFKTNLYSVDSQYASSLLPKRKKRSHKGTYGKVAIIAGSGRMPGAAAYCAKAAYRAGCGYVNLCAPSSVIPLIQQLVPQAVTTSLSEKDSMLCMDSLDKALEIINQSTVCLIGPGLGTGGEVSEFVRHIIENSQIPVIVDADALNAIKDNPSVLKKAPHTPVITPHPLEMSRLSGLDVNYILDNIVEVALDFSMKYNVVTILKDASTIIANGCTAYISNGACSALAKAGSGDILAGLTTGFMAQGLSSTDAGSLAAFVLSRSGMAAALEYSDYSVSCDDIIEKIGTTLLGMMDC